MSYQYAKIKPQIYIPENYQYAKIKPQIYIPENLPLFLKIRDNAYRLTKLAGCFQAERAWDNCSGSTWLMIACLDLLVELGELTELKYGECYAQHRVFQVLRATA